MANTANKAPDEPEVAPETVAEEGTAPIGTPAPDSRFRVKHGSVSGIGRNRKGEVIDQDFYEGAIVTSKQLDGNEAYYFALGAIEPVE